MSRRRVRRNAPFFAVVAGACGVTLALASAPRVAGADWDALTADGIHDPKNPALSLLQQPAEALSVLPPDAAGNRVRWVEALRSGAINPRTNIMPETKVRLLDKDIVFKNTSELDHVVFPHRAHTEWLDCQNCHDKLFKQQAGATRIGMFAVLQGEFCGRCHGAVAFPLTECKRCHSGNPDAGPAAAPARR